MAKVIALINNKGGVGKTTTAVNLAAGIARTWRRVLLIDLDNQGSASLSLGVPRPQLNPSSADVLLKQLPIQEAIRKTSNEWLDLLTGSLELSHTDLRLAHVVGRENMLRNAIQWVKDDYDYILIDCPPSMSMLAVNALVASDGFVVPVSPEYLAVEGLANLGEAFAKMRQGMNLKAELLGIVFTLVDTRKKATREIIDTIRAQYGDRVFETEIRVNVRLSEAPSFGQSIFDYDPESSGAAVYASLVGEVVQKCRDLSQPVTSPKPKESDAWLLAG